MLLEPGTGPLLRRRHEHELRLSRMENQEVGIAADLVLQVGALLPHFSTIGGHVHPDSGRNIDLVGVQWIDHSAVHVIVHPWDDPEGASSIGALQQTTLLYADKQGARVMWVEIDMLGMGDIWRGRESPPGHIHRPQCWEFSPATSEIIAIEQVRGLCPRKNSR